ncbi:hypothetical protein GTC6_05352 [Gordonia terrae C-6]|uniref:Cell division protein ZapA n=1 Tax=Gordonia terrae C-6 TaxID=1316928 RepID=R7YCR5_9ACTN|nr:hypothetical protein [Gordonia terrae]EON33767.1 hypothetical protein GTC6_05352 [Gordonia terrae C-6]
MTERSKIIRFPVERVRGRRSPDVPVSNRRAEFDYSMQLLREAMEKAGEPFPDADPRRAAMATLAMRVCDLVLDMRGAVGDRRRTMGEESTRALTEYNEIRQEVKKEDM